MKKRSEPPSSGLVRINRYLSMCGVASRRKADELIAAGQIQVDGKVMTDLGAKIDPGRSRVLVRGKQVAPARQHVYLVMNKPKDTITTLNDEKGRTTVVSLLHVKQRVYPIGRLDRNTTGVLLFTNDGEFANRLMHPRYEIPKMYRVTCDRSVATQHLVQLRKGVEIGRERTGSAEVYVIPRGKGKEIGITIHEGRNRQVRRMFEALGYEVEKLERVAYGPVTKEGLGRGETRPLSRAEVRKLKEMAGLEER